MNRSGKWAAKIQVVAVAVVVVVAVGVVLEDELGGKFGFKSDSTECLFSSNSDAIGNNYIKLVGKAPR